MRVCQPGPSARKAAKTSGSSRIATCSFVGFRFFPLALRNAPIVEATPPPGVTTPDFQSIPSGADVGAAAAFAAATCSGLKIFKVVLDLRSVCIAARDQVSSVMPLGPNQEDDPSTPHSQALQSQFPVGFAIIFNRDHRKVESVFKFSKINVVLLEIESSLRFVPGDHLSKCICNIN